MSQKQMRIGMSLRGHGYHLAAWRHPEVPVDASVCIDHYVRTAQAAERGKCDLIFFADGLGIRERDVPSGALSRRLWWGPKAYEFIQIERILGASQRRGYLIPHHWAGDARRLCFHGLFQSARAPVISAVNNT